MIKSTACLAHHFPGAIYVILFYYDCVASLFGLLIKIKMFYYYVMNRIGSKSFTLEAEKGGMLAKFIEAVYLQIHFFRIHCIEERPT